MSIVERERGEAMGRRVVRTARSLGVAAPDLRALERIHTVARRPREEALDHDHHPLYLHPGRTALILLLDTGCDEPAVLAAALLAESEWAGLAAPAEAVRDELSDGPPSWLDRALEIREAVPARDTPDLVERLVVADLRTRVVASAERLDHARHAHMVDGGRTAGEWLAEVDEIHLPLARRTHPRLAGRFERWARATRRRLERGGGRG